MRCKILDGYGSGDVLQCMILRHVFANHIQVYAQRRQKGKGGFLCVSGLAFTEGLAGRQARGKRQKDTGCITMLCFSVYTILLSAAPDSWGEDERVAGTQTA